jgi:hypothetical protein
MLLVQYKDSDNNFPYLRRSSKNRSVQLALGNIAELTFGEKCEILNIKNTGSKCNSAKICSVKKYAGVTCLLSLYCEYPPAHI